jgi:hypothetical protein
MSPLQKFIEWLWGRIFTRYGMVLAGARTADQTGTTERASVLRFSKCQWLLEALSAFIVTARRSLWRMKVCVEIIGADQT